jgi:hypothetical protein
VASVLARVHAAGAVVDGVQPELVYVDAAGSLSGLVPRGPRFVATAVQLGGGLRSYPLPYVGYEVIALGKQPTPATDIFALCATLFVLGTGQHPFGSLDSVREVATGILTDQCAPWPHDGGFGTWIARGLAQDAARRPTAAELAGAFAA